MNRILASCLTGLVCFPGVAQGFPSFTNGDIYMLTRAFPDPANPAADLVDALVRIDPVSGQLIAHTMPTGTIFYDDATYDPFRDLILAAGDIHSINTFAADGAMGSIPVRDFDLPYRFAPAGNGRVYMICNTGRVGWLDAADVIHPLMDSTGANPYFVPDFFASSSTCIYDGTTNSLVVAQLLWPNGETLISRITLNASGGQVSGPVDSVVYDCVPGFMDHPASLSAGPNGKLFLKENISVNDLAPRMLLVDPQTLAVATFASDNYSGVFAEMGGTYSAIRQQGIALDTVNDVLRTFSSGESGEGTIFATGVSGSGFNESAKLLTIGGTFNGPAQPGGGATCSGDIAPPGGDHAVDIDDLLAVIMAWGSANPTADIAPPGNPPSTPPGDGEVNIDDLLMVINAWGACP